MSMLLIVDAYNLLKFMIKSPHVSKTQHTRFINNLAAYALLKKLDMLVVFDGGDSSKSEKLSYKGISIIYAGQKSTADDYIKTYVDNKKTKTDILVVSSDRNLCDTIILLGASTIEVAFFAQLLEGVVAPVSVKQKTVSTIIKTQNYESSSELDALMIASSVNPQKADELEVQLLRRGKKKTVSKSEKNMYKILEKL